MENLPFHIYKKLSKGGKMRKNFFILFILISNLTLSNTRNLEMKIVLNKKDMNEIIIDIVPETSKTNFIKVEINKEISKAKVEKKVIKKKKNIIKKKQLEKSIIKVEEESKISKEEKNIIKQEIEIVPIIEKKIEPKITETKSSNKIISIGIIGILVIFLGNIIKKNKGGK